MAKVLEMEREYRGGGRVRRTRSPASKTAIRNKAARRRVARVEAQLTEFSGELLPSFPLELFRTPLGGAFSRMLQIIRILEQMAIFEKGAKSVVASKELPPASEEKTAKLFAAGPRARALLRGKDIATRDLADSGGSYSLEEVRRLMNGVSRQSVEKRVREGRLLAVVGRNNKRFYPVAQFNDEGSVVEGLRAVQDALATRNGYAVLNFLVHPDPHLDNRRPIDLLKQGKIEQVVEAAARVGEQGA